MKPQRTGHVRELKPPRTGRVRELLLKQRQIGLKLGRLPEL